MRVLLCLAAQPGTVVTRDELLATVWNDVTVTDESLTRCISDLRRSFGDDPAQPAIIETIRKVGYRLIAAVESEPDGVAASSSAPMSREPHGASAARELDDAESARRAAPTPAPRIGGSVGRRAGPTLRERGRALALVSAVLVAGVAALLAWADRQRDAAARERESSRQVTDFVIGLFSEFDPESGSPPGLEPRDVLDRQAQRVLHELEGEPETQAALLQAIGRVYLNLGLYGRAGPALERALELQRTAASDRLDVATTLEGLTELRTAQGAYEEAVSLGREALAVRRRSLDPEHPLVARSGFALAQALRWSGAYHEAETLQREALEARRKRLGPRHPEVAESLQNLAVVLLEKGEPDGAEPLYAEAIAIWRALPGGGGEPELSAALNDWGALRHMRGDLDAAEPPLREALAVRRRIYGPDHPKVALTMHNLANLLLDKGDLDAAEPLIREALATRLRLLAADHIAVVKSRGVLAAVLRKRGELDAAEPLLRENVERFRESLTAGHPSFGYALIALGDLLAEKGEPEAAEPLLREGLAIHRRHLPPGHERIARAERALHDCLLDLGRSTEAEEVPLP